MNKPHRRLNPHLARNVLSHSNLFADELHEVKAMAGVQLLVQAS